jgi:hypothetical protein
MRTRHARNTTGAILRRFSLDRAGNIAVMGAVLMLPLTLLAGGASDYARARTVQSQLQNALDAAVLAGAPEGSTAAALAAFKPDLPTGIAQPTPTFTLEADGSVTGVVGVSVPNSFLIVGGVTFLPARARATAGYLRRANNVCLTAVNTSGTGIERQGSGDIHAANCRFDIRSTANPAASFGGNGGDVNASDICLRGSNFNGSRPDRLRTGCTLDDPLKLKIPTITTGGCTASNLTLSNGQSISPGTYCGTIRLTGGGAYVMQPGAYFLKGIGGTPGRFEYSGSGSLTGSGVFFFFEDASLLVLSGNGVNLTAPTSGAYKGVLFHERPGVSTVTDVSLKRTNGAYMRGLINMPSRNFEVDGSGSAIIDDVTMVVRQLRTGGSGAWRFNTAPVSNFDAGAPYLKQ